MCGITGFIYSNVEIDLVNRLIAKSLSVIKNRGPDSSDYSVYRELSLSLIHSRLAINDLSDDGAQPMRSISNRYIIIYNGEIYNNAQLAEQLYQKLPSRRGIYFGKSDTRIFLDYIDEFGLHRSLQTARGMFAFCLVDVYKRKLFLCRDPLGEKPLYYAQHLSEFPLVFSSDIRSFYNFVKPKISKQSVKEYLSFGFISAPNTIFKEVRALEPGQLIEYDLDTRSILAVISYDNPTRSQYSRSKPDNTDELEYLLENSIKSQLKSDVPLGVFLSGGVDSSLISWFANKHYSDQITTFNLAFRDLEVADKSLDESPSAKLASAIAGTNHVEIDYTSTQMSDDITHLGKLLPQPFSDPSLLPLQHLFKEASLSGFKVILTGDGADELFGGYYRHRTLPLLSTINRSPLLSSLIKSWLSIPMRYYKHSLSQNKLQKLRSCLSSSYNSEDVYFRSLQLFSDNILPLSHDYAQACNQDTPKSQKLSNKLAMSIFQQYDLRQYLPNNILFKTDLTSMQYGVEARCPFLDHDLTQLAKQYPSSYVNKKFTSKYPLRAILRKYYPNTLSSRYKHGFTSPLTMWFRGKLKTLAYETLNEDILLQQNILNPSIVKQVLDSHTINLNDYSREIWTLLTWQLWFNANKHKFYY